jgi:hypothetical protein
MGGDASGRDGKWYWMGKVMPLRSGPPPIRLPGPEHTPTGPPLPLWARSDPDKVHAERLR